MHEPPRRLRWDAEDAHATLDRPTLRDGVERRCGHVKRARVEGWFTRPHERAPSAGVALSFGEGTLFCEVDSGDTRVHDVVANSGVPCYRCGVREPATVTRRESPTRPENLQPTAPDQRDQMLVANRGRPGREKGERRAELLHELPMRTRGQASEVDRGADQWPNVPQHLHRRFERSVDLSGGSGLDVS